MAVQGLDYPLMQGIFLTITAAVLIANFLVDLHYQGFPAGLVSSMTTAFLDGYRSHTEGGMPADRLRWHAGVQVLSDAYYFHKRRHLAPDFEVELEHILTLGQDVLGTSQAPSRP